MLASKAAKKAYTHVTAAALRCKDEVMRNVDVVQENCSDILADAKAINEARAAKTAEAVIEDTSEDIANDAAEAVIENAAES